MVFAWGAFCFDRSQKKKIKKNRAGSAQAALAHCFPLRRAGLEKRGVTVTGVTVGDSSRRKLVDKADAIVMR